MKEGKRIIGRRLGIISSGLDRLSQLRTAQKSLPYFTATPTRVATGLSSKMADTYYVIHRWRHAIVRRLLRTWTCLPAASWTVECVDCRVPGLPCAWTVECVPRVWTVEWSEPGMQKSRHSTIHAHNSSGAQQSTHEPHRSKCPCSNIVI